MAEKPLRQRVIDNEGELRQVREQVSNLGQTSEERVAESAAALERRLNDFEARMEQRLEARAAAGGGSGEDFREWIEAIKALRSHVGELTRFLLGSAEAKPPATE